MPAGSPQVSRELEEFDVERFRRASAHLDLMWNVEKVRFAAGRALCAGLLSLVNVATVQLCRSLWHAVPVDAILHRNNCITTLLARPGQGDTQSRAERLDGIA